LQELLEKCAAPEALGVKVIVDSDYVARLPKVHQAVDLVDQRYRSTTAAFVAHVLSLSLLPWLEANGATAAPIGLLLVPICGLRGFVRVVALTATPDEEIELIGQSTVG
jgi:hypothetical protein